MTEYSFHIDLISLLLGMLFGTVIAAIVIMLS